MCGKSKGEAGFDFRRRVARRKRVHGRKASEGRLDRLEVLEAGEL